MPATACREIDRVLSEVREQKRPGYILLSTDVARFPTEPPGAPLPRYTGGTSPRALSLFTEAATKLIGDQQLTVLADLLVHRLQAVNELEALLAADVVPHATLMWGKSLLDESSPNFLGIYAGSASTEHVRTAIEQAPALVTAGVVFTDMVSGFFSQHIDPARTIDIGQYQSSVADKVFAPLEMGAALGALAAILAGRGITSPPVPAPPDDPPVPTPPRDEPLTQQMLWDRLNAALTPGNVVLADQGTSFYGMADHGAAQLTVQELGTFSREGLSPVIVVVNNDGYTVERAIHGETAPYNDIVSWRWTDIPNALGVADHLAFRARTYGELDDAFTAAAEHQDRMVLVESVLPRLEIPRLLGELVQPMSPDGSVRR
jgi:indolepyruvate decarboxylase